MSTPILSPKRKIYVRGEEFIIVDDGGLIASQNTFNIPPALGRYGTRLSSVNSEIEIKIDSKGSTIIVPGLEPNTMIVNDSLYKHCTSDIVEVCEAKESKLKINNKLKAFCCISETGGFILTVVTLKFKKMIFTYNQNNDDRFNINETRYIIPQQQLWPELDLIGSIKESKLQIKSKIIEKVITEQFAGYEGVYKIWSAKNQILCSMIGAGESVELAEEAETSSD